MRVSGEAAKTLSADLTHQERKRCSCRAERDRPPAPPQPQTARPPAHVLLGNIPRQASERDVELHVAAVAPVVTVGLPRGRDGRTIGVAFVVLADPGDAARVVRALDGSVFQGRPLRASLARS